MIQDTRARINWKAPSKHKLRKEDMILLAFKGISICSLDCQVQLFVCVARHKNSHPCFYVIVVVHTAYSIYFLSIAIKKGRQQIKNERNSRGRFGMLYIQPKPHHPNSTSATTRTSCNFSSLASHRVMCIVSFPRLYADSLCNLRPKIDQQ